MAKEPQVAPPPAREDVFNNIDVAQARVVDGRKNRPRKQDEIFNTRGRVGLKDDIDQQRRELSTELKRNVTRGEMMDILLAAYKEKKSGQGFEDLMGAAKHDVPTAKDEANGRTKKLSFWTTADVIEALNDRVATTGWELSVVFEDIMAKASRFVNQEHEK